MSKIGDKRSSDEGAGMQQTKMATPSSSLLFKPSSLASVASTLPTYSKDVPSDTKKPRTELPKFQLNEGKESVKSPVKFTGPSIMKADTPRSLDNGGLGSPLKKRPLNGSSDGMETPSKRSNLFIECLSTVPSSSSSSSVQPTTSVDSTTQLSDEPHQQETTKDKGGFLFGEHLSSRVVGTSQDGSTHQSTSKTPSVSDEKDSPKIATSGSSIGGVSQQTPPSIMFPAVETVTGEEGERHVTQISCTLYVFDSASHNWKERGRGELRLNDTPKSEGAYQSRLIMRLSGSRRVCLNTHLWSSMKFERIGKKSIRVTAQEPNGGFGVYIIKGLPKDISSMFDAVNRRLDALKMASSRENQSETTSCDRVSSPTSEPRPSLLAGCPDDEDDCIHCPKYSSSPSSLESSPERVTERLDKPYTSSYDTSPTQLPHPHTATSPTTVLFSSDAPCTTVSSSGCGLERSGSPTDSNEELSESCTNEDQ